MKDKYMKIALSQSLKAKNSMEIPVGAVIVKDDRIISRGYNNRHRYGDVFGHAEIIAIKKATKRIKDWRLDDCEMYVTLEPCTMCKAIINEARIKKVYYLVPNKSKGIQTNISLHNNVSMAELYSKELSDFFVKIR